jgi:hypothetical protein
VSSGTDLLELDVPNPQWDSHVDKCHGNCRSRTSLNHQESDFQALHLHSMSHGVNQPNSAQATDPRVRTLPHCLPLTLHPTPPQPVSASDLDDALVGAQEAC